VLRTGKDCRWKGINGRKLCRRAKRKLGFRAKEKERNLLAYVCGCQKYMCSHNISFMLLNLTFMENYTVDQRGFNGEYHV
jgi:hypothetical protein